MQLRSRNVFGSVSGTAIGLSERFSVVMMVDEVISTIWQSPSNIGSADWAGKWSRIALNHSGQSAS